MDRNTLRSLEAVAEAGRELLRSLDDLIIQADQIIQAAKAKRPA